MENYITDIFKYFAQYPTKAGVLKMFKKTNPDNDEYITLKDYVTALPDVSFLPTIDDFVFGISENLVENVIRNLKKKFLYVEYGQSTTNVNPNGHQQDSDMFLSINIAYQTNSRLIDAVEETILMNQLFLDLITIENKLKQDGKDTKCWANRLIVYPVERIPIDPKSFFNAIGWSLIFKRKLDID